MQLHGDPVVFQYLFWFYLHPAVYVTLLGSIMTSGAFCFWKRRRLSL